MKLSQSLVEVKTITCDRPRSEFPDTEIEEAAKLIIEAEGIINPLILTRTGINSFAVKEGDFEYYAAARAREIDKEKGETIAAYIIEGENEAINEQIEIFRKPDKVKISLVKNLQARLNNLESRIDNRLSELKSEYTQKTKEIEQELKSFNSKLPEQIEPLTTFNQANLTELTIKLKSILRSDKTASDIATKIEKARPFNSLNEVLNKTKGLGEKTMLRIIDRWLYNQ